MGIAIHYRGRINDLAAIPRVREELVDIASTMDWTYREFDEDFAYPPSLTLTHHDGAACLEGHAAVKGVTFTPHPDCETVSILFDAQGCLRDLMGVLSICEGQVKPEQAWVHVKTQFAGADTHIAIIKLLRYLQARYISTLEVQDEGEYWDTGDARRLTDKIAFLERRMDELTNGLRNVERDSDVLDSEGVAGKIEETIRQIWKDGAPMDVVCGKSRSCPPEVEAQFLANIDAIENAPISNLTDELLKKGIVVPKPDELDDAELYAKLWEVLNALADMRHYLYPTDHLSDRELYAKLYEEILPEETEIVSSASGWNTHIEVLRAGCEEDDHTWLKYYADEQTRASWRKNFPDLEIPAHEDPPYHRDIELPQPDPPTH